MDIIIHRLDELIKLTRRQKACGREILSFKEACIYLDFSEAYLYQLTSGCAIPFYKPNGKKIYFKREELDQWLLRNRQSTMEELESEIKIRTNVK